MSYDLHLLRVSPGESAAVVMARREYAQMNDLNPGPLNPACEAEKTRLAKALMRFDPGLAIAPFDYAGLARIEEIEEAEVRVRYRHIELNAGNFTGIQITLWDQSADLTFPLWHSGGQARQVLHQAWEYLELLERWGEFTTFDPQLDRVLNLAKDFQNVWQRYSEGNQTPEARSQKAGW